MAYEWSNEQEDIMYAIDKATLNKGKQVVVLKAVAGAAKSSTVVESIKRVYKKRPGTVTRVLGLGKANADELTGDYGHSAQVSTIHSMAFRALKKKGVSFTKIVPYLASYNIPKDYEKFSLTEMERGYIVALVEGFTESSHIEVIPFLDSIEEEVSDNIRVAFSEVLKLMFKGKIAITHSFYLALYHSWLVRGKIKPEKYDVLVIEEVQDCTAALLDICLYSEWNTLVVSGDPYQNIMSWMPGAVDAFATIKPDVELTLSKSFRVGAHIAKGVQSFMQEIVDSSFIFEGIDYNRDYTIKSEAILCRTNADLIGLMIEKDIEGVRYNLSSKTKINSLFSVPLALIYTKPFGTQKDPHYFDLQDKVNAWAKNKAGESKYKYLLRVYASNGTITSAIKLIVRFSSEVIIATQKRAKEHKGNTHKLTLSTSSSFKGLTTDRVVLDKSCDKAIQKAYTKTLQGVELTKEEITELYIYYVAITRARYECVGSKYLTYTPL